MSRRLASAPPGLKRRQVLCVALAGLTAGCTGMFTDDSPGDADGDLLEQVPEGVTTLVSLEAATGDEGTARLLEDLEGLESGHADLGNRRTTLEDRTGLDLLSAEEVFLVEDSEGSVTYLLEGEWTVDTVVSGAEDAEGVSYEQLDVEGETALYGPDGDGYFIGDLGGGQVVVGSETAVRDTLAVRYGGADPLGGPVREVYDAAGAGNLVVASEPDGPLVPEEYRFDSPLVDFSVFDEVEAVAKSYGVADDGYTLEAALLAPDAETAEDLEGATEGLFAVLRSVDDPGEYLGVDADDGLAEALEDIGVEGADRIVRLSYEGEATDVFDVLEGI